MNQKKADMIDFYICYGLFITALVVVALLFYNPFIQMVALTFGYSIIVAFDLIPRIFRKREL